MQTLTLRTAVLRGLTPVETTITITAEPEGSGLRLVGLREVAARETRVRVLSALARLGTDAAALSATVRVEPPPTGACPHLDLPIAIGLMALNGRFCFADPAGLSRMLLLGELGLSGSVRPVRGVLPLVQWAQAAGLGSAIVPTDNSREAGLGGLPVRSVSTLTETADHLAGTYQAPDLSDLPKPARLPPVDFADIRGQAATKRALEIAAAGGHGLLIVGPPGTGKTLLARALLGILPGLTASETLEATAIHSVAGLVDRSGAISRPFRAPHHSVSEAGLVGGGTEPRPGEVSLAHRGVLFLDDLPEFRAPALESLARALRDQQATISRSALGRVWFPARPQVVAAANPCPCGFAGHPRRACACTEQARARYSDRLRAALPGVFDVVVTVEPTSPVFLVPGHESSATVRARVERARDRLAANPPGWLGSEPSGLSERVRRVACTIAALDGADHIGTQHMAEAIALQGAS